MRPYSLWMMQRSRDVYRELTPTERERADDWLVSVGGETSRDFADPPRLRREGLSVAPE